MRESGFSLPRQHSLVHYRINIQDFCAPNGLHSSIKKEILGYKLITDQRLDKLADVQADFIAPEMLPPDCGPSGANADDDDDCWGPIDDERVMADVELARTQGA